MDTPPPPRLLTRQQVAERLGCSRRHVARLGLPIAQRLPGATGATLYREADVAALEADRDRRQVA